MSEVDPVSRAVVAVSWPVKAKLNGLRLEMQLALGRQVTFNQVMEALLAEHEAHKEEVIP